MRATLASLAPHFQSVLLLREMEGLPCNEIAHIVGATHVTVRWRLHRGRKLFQEEWERRARLREKGGDRAIETGELDGEANERGANDREAMNRHDSMLGQPRADDSTSDASRRSRLLEGNDPRKARGGKREAGHRGGSPAGQGEGEES